VTRTLEGLAHASGQAAADGTVRLPPLPAGRYRVTVIPADGDETSALVGTTVDVGAGAPAAVQLGARVHLRGTLEPAAMVTGTRLYATPRAVDPPRPVATALVGGDGSYDLAVDPGREYVVWADPPAGRAFARSLLAAVSSGTAGAEIPTRTLPRSLPFTSLVSGDGLQGGGVPGVVLQAFCDAASPSCLDPTLPLAETVTGQGGRFTIALPDPGSF
jgi:hypothetical protein